MRMIRVLRQREFAFLWGGQALSAIGDEIYRVALIWLAINFIGANAGYLVAGQSAALLLAALFVKNSRQPISRFKVLLAMDVLRGLVVLIPMLAYYFIHPFPVAILWTVAIIVSLANGVFDPTFHGSFPAMTRDAETRQVLTALVGSTFRLARAVGPGLIGLLASILPMAHFFSIDALSFGISALTFFLIIKDKKIAKDLVETGRSDQIDIRFALNSICKNSLVLYATIAKSIGGSLWVLVYSLGLAFLVKKMGQDVRGYGLACASYGIGNVLGSIFLANMRRNPLGSMLRYSFLWMGLGFFLLALSPNLQSVMVLCAITGFVGPMNDIPYYDLVQELFPLNSLPNIFRVKIISETAFCLAVMLVAPSLFRLFSPSVVIAGAGIGYFLIGVTGLSLFRANSALPLCKNYSEERQGMVKKIQNQIR